jgi:hypothetical protein
MLWLVTITGERFFSSVASATNSSATSIKPATERKASAGIPLLDLLSTKEKQPQSPKQANT